MDTAKLDVKVYAAQPPGDPSAVQPRDLIPVFHRWIQSTRLDELAIDVADYSHVPVGPGVLLICHDAHYAFDCGPDGPGLLYSRRRETRPSLLGIGDPVERWLSAIERALVACVELEREPDLAGRLTFPGNRLLLRVNDRLAATNVVTDRERLTAQLDEVARTLFPSGAKLEIADDDPRARPGWLLLAGESPGASGLLERVTSARAGAIA